MRTQTQIKKIADGIYSDAMNTLVKLEENKKDFVSGVADKSAEDALAVVKAIVSDVETIVKGSRCEGVGMPGFISKISVTDGDNTKVTLSIRSKLKADYKFSRERVIAINDDIIESIATFYTDALFEMFYLDIANENVKELNDKIAGIIAENEIPFSVSFVVSDTAAAIVSSISDNNLVLNASVSSAHEISNLGIFFEGNEYNDMVAAESTNKLVNELKAVQTPVQFLKSNNDLIKKITGVSTKKRASKLIREICHRKAENLNGVKQGIGYYNNTVDVNGEEVEVFALVEKAEDGTKTVILSPFNVKTLENVEVDVLAAI